jgi:hypothetical protein
MTNEDKRQKLETAARLVDEVAATLDTTGSTCQCCQGFRYTNFSERQMSVEMLAISAKLRRFAHKEKR